MEDEQQVDAYLWSLLDPMEAKLWFLQHLRKAIRLPCAFQLGSGRQLLSNCPMTEQWVLHSESDWHLQVAELCEGEVISIVLVHGDG